MDSFETECRRLIDGLVRELVALAKEVATDEIARARAAREVERARAPRVSARLARALERAEERRRLAAERRAAKLAARPASRRAKAATGSTDAGPAAEAEKVESLPAAPKPLFVHKRSRDGSIQQLERNVGDSVPPPPA
jgi:hypothetical protein